MFQSQALQILNVYMYRKRDNIKMYTGWIQMNRVLTLVLVQWRENTCKTPPVVEEQPPSLQGCEWMSFPPEIQCKHSVHLGPLEDLWNVQNVLFSIITWLLLRYTSYCFCRAYEENLPHICVTVNFSCRIELVETVITVLSCALL